MASPVPWEFKVCMKGKCVGLVHKCRRSCLGVGVFWHQGVEDRHQPFSAPRKVGLEARVLPSAIQVHFIIHISLYARTGFLSSCGVLFIFLFFFLNHYCIKKCFSFGKGYRGANTVRSLLPSITTKNL